MHLFMQDSGLACPGLLAAFAGLPVWAFILYEAATAAALGFALISNASKKKISFGAMGATRMACHKDDNYKYTTAVSETAAYKIGKNNDTLELKNKKGEIVVRLTRTQK